MRSARDCVSTWTRTSSGIRPVRTSPEMKSNSVAPALGKPTSISLRPTLTSRSKNRVFFSVPIGSISDWLPSRRSVESQRGARSMTRDGHCRSGRAIWLKGRYLADGSLSMVMKRSRSVWIATGDYPLGAARVAADAPPHAQGRVSRRCRSSANVIGLPMGIAPALVKGLGRRRAGMRQPHVYLSGGYSALTGRSGGATP